MVCDEATGKFVEDERLGAQLLMPCGIAEIRFWSSVADRRDLPRPWIWRARGIAAMVIERSAYDDLRIGEHLTPAGVLQLRALDSRRPAAGCPFRKRWRGRLLGIRNGQPHGLLSPPGPAWVESVSPAIRCRSGARMRVVRCNGPAFGFVGARGEDRTRFGTSISSSTARPEHSGCPSLSMRRDEPPHFRAARVRGFVRMIVRSPLWPS